MSTANTLVIKRRFAAPRERVYAMWTTEDLLMRWFCPGGDMTVPEAEVDAREGGRYRILMRGSDGKTYSPSGIYETVVPNERLVFSWKWADSELITRVTLEFHAIGDTETELVLTHEGFADAKGRDSHQQGWDGCLTRLETALLQSMQAT